MRSVCVTHGENNINYFTNIKSHYINCIRDEVYCNFQTSFEDSSKSVHHCGSIILLD